MTDKPYTDDDVKLVARALADAEHTPRWVPDDADPDEAERGHYAHAVLAALAVDGRLAPIDDDPRHIIEFRPDGWTIKHPLSCRIGDLFGCRVNLAAEDLGRPPYLGGYEVTVDSIDGRLRVGDRVDQEATAPEANPADAEADQVAVRNLLDDATRAIADAGTSGERVEVIRDLLAGWYAAWPASAVTDEHEGIAHQLVALVNAAEARAAACPCLPGAPKHRHGVGGYAPDVPADNPVPEPADPEAASRVIAAAEALERRLWTRGLTEDDMTPEHRELAQALASYNSFVRTAAGGGIVHSPVDADHPPAGLRCRHSEMCVGARPQHHVIAFAGDGTWSLEHPATCRAENDAADAADWDCPVRKLAERGVAGQMAGPLASGRYECWANRLGDVFLLGDRVDPAEGGCERCAAHLICPTHDDPRRSEG